MNRYRDDANPGSGNHHHRCHLLAGEAQGEIGKKFRMAGKTEAGFIKHGFRNGIGNDGGSLALDGQGNGGLDRLDRCMGRADMRLACLYLETDGKGKDRKSAIEKVDGIGHIARLDIDRNADQGRTARHHIRIAYEDEGRHAVFPAPGPGGNGDIRADTGWVSLCQGKRQGCMCHGKAGSRIRC